MAAGALTWAADHLEAAAIAARDLDPADREPPDRAADALVAAGDRARRRMESRSALDLYLRALAIAGPEDRWGVREARALAGIGEARYWLSEYAAATEVLDRAIALGTELDDDWTLAIALRFRGDVAINVDADLDAAEAMLARSLAAAERWASRGRSRALCCSKGGSRGPETTTSFRGHLAARPRDRARGRGPVGRGARADVAVDQPLAEDTRRSRARADRRGAGAGRSDRRPVQRRGDHHPARPRRRRPRAFRRRRATAGRRDRHVRRPRARAGSWPTPPPSAASRSARWGCSTRPKTICSARSACRRNSASANSPAGLWRALARVSEKRGDQTQAAERFKLADQADARFWGSDAPTST